MALGKGGLCRVPTIRHSAKRVLNFFKKNSSLPSAFTGALGKDISKKKSLPSAVLGALGKVCSKTKSLPSARSGTLVKDFFFKNLLCRVPNSRHSAKKDVAEHRYVGQPMPSAVLLPRAWHSAKKSFAESLFLPSVRHSAKNSLSSAILCRVRHSAKKVFAECPIFDTRQSSLHLANALFPVVMSSLLFYFPFFCHKSRFLHTIDYESIAICFLKFSD